MWRFLRYQNRNNFEKSEKRKDQAPLRPQKKQNKTKQKTLFYRWTDLLSRVGQAFFPLLLILVAKMTLKTQKFRENTKKKKKIRHFLAEKFWENILTYFQKNFSQTFQILVKKQLILQDFRKIKKN